MGKLTGARPLTNVELPKPTKATQALLQTKSGIVKELLRVGTVARDREEFAGILDHLQELGISLPPLAEVLYGAARCHHEARLENEIIVIWAERDEARKRILRDLPPLLQELRWLAAPVGRIASWAEELGDALPAWARVDELPQWAELSRRVCLAIDGLEQTIASSGGGGVGRMGRAPVTRNNRGLFRQPREGTPSRPWIKAARQRMLKMGIDEQTQKDLLRLVGAPSLR